MTGRIAGVLFAAFHEFSRSQRYPTRSVEHAFAWILIVWSYSVLAHGQMMTERVYGPMLAVMPAAAWGWAGVVLGCLRALAIMINGRWHPTPELRLLGAVWAMMFWIALIYCYGLAIAAGAPDFPMRRALYVLVIFEIYSCYRCGQDIGRRHHRRAETDSSAPYRLGAGYG